MEVAKEGMDDGTKEGEGNAEGWQDLEDYQREQSIDVGENGRGAGETGGDEEVEVVDAEDGDGAPKAKKVKTKQESAGKVVDKEARKLEKAARKKEEKRRKAMEAQAKAKANA